MLNLTYKFLQTCDFKREYLFWYKAYCVKNHIARLEKEQADIFDNFSTILNSIQKEKLELEKQIQNGNIEITPERQKELADFDNADFVEIYLKEHIIDGLKMQNGERFVLSVFVENMQADYEKYLKENPNAMALDNIARFKDFMAGIIKSRVEKIICDKKELEMFFEKNRANYIAAFLNEMKEVLKQKKGY